MSILKMKSKGQRPSKTTRGGSSPAARSTTAARSASAGDAPATEWRSRRKVLKLTQREWKRRRQSIITNSAGSLVVVKRNKAS